MRTGKMTNRILGIALVAVLIGAMLPLGALAGHGQVRAAPATIYVPDDYLTIQGAVDAASPGDTIIVRDGPYTENITVTTDNVTIHSESGAKTTAIQTAAPNAPVFRITADYVEIRGFTIKGDKHPSYGIMLEEAGHSAILDNIISGSYAILLHNSSHNQISDNVLSNSTRGIFARLGSSYNVIKHNRIMQISDSGLWLWGSEGNTITDNIIDTKSQYGTFASWGGIYLDNSSRNKIIDNAFGRDGIVVRESGQNTIEDNTVDGRPLAYLEGVSDHTITEAGQVILVKSNNITVEGLEIAASVPIQLLETTDSRIANNTLTATGSTWHSGGQISRLEVYLENSSANVLTGHHRSRIYLVRSPDNDIINNNIQEIALYHSPSNRIIGNEVSNAFRGLRVVRSPESLIKDNTFVRAGLVIERSMNNVVENNTVNGKPLVYLEGVSDRTVTDAGQVILVNCDNMTITNNDFRRTSWPIQLIHTSNSVIAYNNLVEPTEGVIFLQNSSANLISDNTLKSGYAVYWSLYLEYSNNNVISNNIILDRGSISLRDSSANKIYLNDIYNPGVMSTAGFSNTWSSPEKKTYVYGGETHSGYLGNYWSDYAGSDTDGDGIGDVPYDSIFDSRDAVGVHGDADSYPLVEPFENYLIQEPQPPPPNGEPTQPVNLFPADGALTVSLSPFLKSSPPLQGVAKESIPWEEWSEGLWVTRVDSEWRITDVQGDYSSPVWSSTLKDGLVARHWFPDLPDAWSNYVAEGLDYETTYYWQVRHKDFRGVWSPWSDETSFTTRAFRPPEAKFTYSSETFLAGDKVEFDARGSIPGESAIQYYLWDLTGDGKTDGVTTRPTLYYFWDISGTYAVTLTVVNRDEDTHSTTQYITIEKQSWWQRNVVSWWRRVFGSAQPSQEELNSFETIKRELRLSDDGRFYDSGTRERERDYQIMLALKEEVPEEGGITYEGLILQVLHDMELVDFYLSSPSPPLHPIIEAWFTDIDRVSLWAEAGLSSGGAALAGIVRAAGSSMSGLGISMVLALPTALQGVVTIRALVATLHNMQRWFFFRGFDDPDWWKLMPEEREYLEKLRDEYAGPLSGPGREVFKEQVRENLRKILYYVFEPYKSWPVHTYQVNSPAELRVYDSEGNVAGVIEGQVSEEVAGAVYVDGTVLIYPALGSYYFDLVGTAGGCYGVTVTNATDGVELSFTATNIPTSPGIVHRFTIDWDALADGENGVIVEVDSDGDGEFDHTFTAGSELTGDQFILHTETFIDFDPNTLNLRGRGGGVVTVYIELPEDFDVNDIDVSTILLNGTVSALAWPYAIGDYNNNGIPDLMVKFDSRAVHEVVEVGESVEITITGEVDGIPFMGVDTIRVIGR